VAGFWRQHQLWDGTYTFQDLVDFHEMFDVTENNKERIREAENERLNAGRH
jgi:hypothetical protein